MNEKSKFANHKTMTTSTTPTSQYNNTFNNSNNNADQSYSNLLCGVYNQRILFETPSTTTTSTTFPNLTTKTVSSCTTTNDFVIPPPKVQMLNALPSLKADLFLNDSGLFTVYHFIKNFIG